MSSSSKTVFWNIFAVCTLFTICCVALIPFIYFYTQLFGSLLIVLMISWHLSSYVKYYWCQSRIIDVNNKAVVISGCDSGFGFEIAKQLDSIGFHVFAGCLDPNLNGPQKLRELCSNRLQIFKLDVTKETCIKEAFKRVTESELQLWSLVNNAGVCDAYFLEESSDNAAFHKVFDVNVFGVISLTKRLLPLLRQSNGRVVNISSVAGDMSKFAVRAFSDGLRREMSEFNVDVICVEPFVYATNITNSDTICNQIERNWQQTADDVKSSYGDAFKRKMKSRVFASMKLKRDKIYEVVNSIEHAITSEQPDIYYLCCGALQRPFLRLLFIAPEFIQDFIISGSLIKLFFKLFKTKSSKKK
ncbi:D-beta-hydroxybutyrate dehydrogenase-like protein [Leptotrombidium deliense]|uniref:D-beta-hydroxybutyrate dehydrogenase-like protein n=1 Tax=Leptotrombidium deliense TaxID=299467 RepID=A0A443S3C2_9ACAR|nr:D-beta-hydroxybutyrate dehydrogenase-like protein [Leptotrombidium deliense]